MSSYRDDLEAAHARIRALEAQVGGAAQGESLGPLFERLAAVEARATEVAEAAPRVADLEQQIAALQAKLAKLAEEHAALLATVRAQPPGEAPTLVEHNRRFPPVDEGVACGVTCPMCLLITGTRVEMQTGSAFGIDVGSDYSETVSCGWCGYVAAKRTA